MNLIEQAILKKIGDAAVQKIKQLDPHEIAAFVEHLFKGYAQELLTDTDGNGKTQLEDAINEVEQGAEHFKNAARIIHGVKK